MNIQEQIQELKEQLAELENQLENQLAIENWEPKGKGYIVTSSGILPTNGINKDAQNYGTTFDNEENASKAFLAYKNYHRLYKLAEELNQGWEPDWNNPDEEKWCINIGHATNSLWASSRKQNTNICSIVFKDYETTLKAISIIELNKLN